LQHPMLQNRRHRFTGSGGFVRMTEILSCETG